MLITFASAVIFSEILAGFPKVLSDIVKSFWIKWELRILVLTSLGLQFILVICGNRWKRKRPRIWSLAFVWSAYLLADWIASVSLNTLFRNSGEIKSKFNSPTPNYEVMAFWGPFLLLHLGGPDTITAYSFNDNDLWLRRLIGLALQIGIASYIYSILRTTAFRIVAIPVLVAGVIKCAERIFALWSASSGQFRNSLFDKVQEPKPSIQIQMEEGQARNENCLQSKRGDLDSQVGPNVIPQAKYLHEANILFNMLRFLIANVSLKFKGNVYSSFTIYGKKSAEAFKLVEVELGFMYDMLYTKASIMQSCWGPVLRFISLLCYVSALVAFILVISKDPAFSTMKHNNTDVTITYLLLVGAIVLDIHGAMTHIFSNWTMLRLSMDKRKKLKRFIYNFIASWKPDASNGHSREISIPQLNLIRFCLSNLKAKHYKVDKCFDTYHNRLGKYWNTTYVAMHDELKKRIYFHIKQKCVIYGFSSFEFRALRVLLDERGLGALELEENSCNSVPMKETLSKEFDHSLLIWHIATDICYHDEPADRQLDCGNIKALSDYMFYLMVMLPNMMPRGISDIRIQHTRSEAIRYLEQMHGKIDESRACNAILESPGVQHLEEIRIQIFDESQKSLLCEAVILARILKNNHNRWKLIGRVWMEMLTYAASHCEWKYHAAQLGEGGELLTHVCLLMAHFGLSEQIHIVNSSDQDVPSLHPNEHRGLQNDRDTWVSVYLSSLA